MTAAVQIKAAPVPLPLDTQGELEGIVRGEDLAKARHVLGRMWGFGRPLHGSELGRALRLTGRDPGATVYDWERKDTVSGPVSVAVELMLKGVLPPDPLDKIRKRET